MLIPSTAVGSVIGKAGVCINEIRDRSGAAVAVLKSEKQVRYRNMYDLYPDFTVVKVCLCVCLLCCRSGSSGVRSYV